MTPMHLQLVSDANGEWAPGLPAARVDPGDTEEMVVVVVGGGGRGRWRGRDGARAAAGRGGGEKNPSGPVSLSTPAAGSDLF